MATKDICFCNAKHISLAGAAICFALATSCVWTRWICLSSARNQRPCRFQLRLDLARKDLYYDHSPAFSVKHRAAYELRHTHLCVQFAYYTHQPSFIFSLCLQRSHPASCLNQLVEAGLLILFAENPLS